MTTLPDKPSELIRVALVDLEKCEADPRYLINMGSWHSPTCDTDDCESCARDRKAANKPNGRCYVCLAGAVMAQSLDTSPRKAGYPGSFAEAAKLRALNDFRVGSVLSGLQEMGLGSRNRPESRDVVAYEEDASAFKRDMRTLADDLEKAGL